MLANYKGVSAGFEARGDAINRQAFRDLKSGNPLDPTHRLLSRSVGGRLPTFQNYSSARRNGIPIDSGYGDRPVQFRNASLTSLGNNRNPGKRSPERRLHGDHVSAGRNGQFGSAIPRQQKRSDALRPQDGQHIETAAFIWPFIRALAGRAISRGGPVVRKGSPKTGQVKQLPGSKAGADRGPAAGSGNQPRSAGRQRGPGSKPQSVQGRHDAWKLRALETERPKPEQGDQDDRDRFDPHLRRVEDIALELNDYIRTVPELPQKYWFNHGKKVFQTTPGVRMVQDYNKASTTDVPYHRTKHFDMFGREIGQTHRSHHGQPDPNSKGYHPNPHHHRRDPVDQNRMLLFRGKEIWPGLFGNPWFKP